jgi:hypothetical protein
MSRNGDYHLYGRVAPFADCTKFTPPPGTAMLCETTPRSERPITDAYIFSYWHSPAVRVFGSPFNATPEASAKVGQFARAAMFGQPGDYLTEVGAGMLRYVAPESDWLHGYGGGPGYQALTGKNILLNPNFQGDAIDSLQRYYGWHESDYTRHGGLLAALRHYEKFTRIQGIIFVALALASFAGPFVSRGRERRVIVLFWLVAWCMLTAPVASLEFSARTAVPGFGFLGTSAALGGVAAFRVAERRWRGAGKSRRGLQPETAG